MKRLFFILASVALCVSATNAQTQTVQTPVKTGSTGYRMYNNQVPRTEIILPQIKGLTAYKGDFHVHTIYSDGEVTPRERMREAWYDGLDIIALTDHLEKRTYEKNMLKALAPYNSDGKPYTYAHAGAGNKDNSDAPLLLDFNAVFDEAQQIIEKEHIPILAVRGTEIWRNPSTVGEYNALFLKDINAIFHKDLFESLRRVKAQGGIIIHNHPGWRRKTMEKSSEQYKIYEAGLVDGVEVVNGIGFYPQMIDRCVNEKLAIFANTDVHRPSSQVWHRGSGIFRTMTIIYAKECTEKAIKEAIFKHRTIGYCANNLMGEEKILKEFMDAALDCKLVDIDEKAGYRVFQITNTCSIPFILRRLNSVYEVPPFQSVRVKIGKWPKTGKYCDPQFIVENMWTVGDKHPNFMLAIDK